MVAIARLARSRLYVVLMRHSLHSRTPGWHQRRELVSFGRLRTRTTPVNSELVVSGKPQGSKQVTSRVSRGSRVVVPGETYRFPSGVALFKIFRNELVYIDKTQFIVPVSDLDAILLCRPGQFGKTLTRTMLQYFHGVEFRDQYDILFKVCGLVK
jgi:hypothetical protein